MRMTAEDEAIINDHLSFGQTELSERGVIDDGDRCEAERFITRENNKVFDRIPVAIVIKDKIELVLRYPNAGDGPLAVY